MPQMRHAVRARSALADTWPDRTSTPAVPASAPSIHPPLSSAEPRRLPSRPLHGHARRGPPRDATDKEPPAPPQLRSCGRYRIELYNESRPHTALGWLTRQEFALAAAQMAAEGPPEARLPAGPKTGGPSPVVGLYPNMEEFQRLRSVVILRARPGSSSRFIAAVREIHGPLASRNRSALQGIGAV
jgi:hypothetical protein